MLVKILNFGCNWWHRYGSDPEDRYCYTRRAAFFNSTGVQCGKKVRRHWIIPGLIRFNGAGDFNPHFPNRSVGRTYSCTDPAVAFGGNRVVFQQQVRGAVPDFFLVVASSERCGRLNFASSYWHSPTAIPIAASELRERQQAMLLMHIDDWVDSGLGRWRLRRMPQLDLGVMLQLDDE